RAQMRITPGVAGVQAARMDRHLDGGLLRPLAEANETLESPKQALNLGDHEMPRDETDRRMATIDGPGLGTGIVHVDAFGRAAFHGEEDDVRLGGGQPWP